MRLLLSILFITFIAGQASAQAQNDVRRGNELYAQKKYKEAAQAYLEALKKDPNSLAGNFNLGNTLLQQGQLEQARKVLEQAARHSGNDPNQQSGANYNIGNSYMQQQQWADAVESYKRALRKNPNDADAKYNLSYALSKMKQQQQQNKDNKKDKNKDQQKQQQKQQQDQKDKNKDQQQQQGNGDQKKEEQQQQPQPQPSRLTQQQADNILNALAQEEKKIQDKQKAKQGAPSHQTKDW